MSHKAVVQVRTAAVSAAQEPLLTATLIQGTLTLGMECDWHGVLMIIQSLQSVAGDSLSEFSSGDQSVIITVHISEPEKLLQLSGQRLTFWSERSIPVLDTINPWQPEPTS